MASRIGANGTTIRRVARIRAIATAIGLDRVAATVVVATGDAPVLRVARAIQMAMLRQHLPAATGQIARWWLKALGRFNPSQCELLRDP
jgi:hypothetical protein